MSRSDRGREAPGDLSRPSTGTSRLDEQRYNVRLELERGTELAMNRRCLELGIKGPKGMIVYALIQAGVAVDERDRHVLRRMDQAHAPVETSAPHTRTRK
jgi:hypothetical protein